MSNVHTLNDIKDREGGSYKKPGHRLGSAYEQELEKKLRSITEFNSEINDLSGKLVDKYNEREKEFENKASQLIASSTKVRSQLISEQKSYSKSQRELEAKYTAEIQSLKSENKTLKRKATLAQKASSADKLQILSLETKIRELEDKLKDIDLERTYHDSLKLELKRANEDLNSKNHEIECMEKGMEATHEITSREIDILRKERLNSMEKNSCLWEIISKKDNEIADLTNPSPPLPPIDDSLQKLPGWLSDDLRPLVYEHGLEDKVMELDKSFARENILEALQELLPQNKMVSRSQTDTLFNQSIHSRPVHSKNFISREGIAKQLGGAEAVPLSQEIPLTPVTVPVITSSLILPMVMYSILALLLIAVIWLVGRKY
jgi:chromosome segregation ATPase